MTKKLKKIWKNYSLSIVLLALFLFSWTAQFFVQIKEVEQEAITQGQNFEWNNFWIKYWSSTLQNWQSEFLQLFTFVVLTAYLIHKNSHESRDSNERMEKKIDYLIEAISQEKEKNK